MEIGIAEPARIAAAASSKRRTATFWTLLFCLVAATAGVLDVWLLVGWREIDPRNLSWLSGDAAVYQIGWEFFRSERSWHLPLTWIARLDYPTGASASYLDFIPLVAIPLRLASPLLPPHVQYLGLYAALCFVLQAWFGLRLTSLFAGRDRIVTLLGGAFFLVSPVLTKELYGHFALLSQWIVLAALYCYFRISPERSLRANLAPLVLLAAVASGIQPYFALMTVIIGIAAAVRACPRDRPAACFGWIAILGAAALLSLMLFGFVVPGKSQFAGVGYTHYSMNLLAPIDPETPWALYFKAAPVVHGWTLAGYDYLGMGVLLLMFVALARRPSVLTGLWSGALRPLVCAALLCTLLALSVEISFGDHVLLTIALPKFVFDLLAAFRGSGRLFWPAYYLLTLAAIAGILVSVPSRAARRALLAVALIIQIADILPIREGVAAAAELRHPPRLVSPEWAALPAHYRHLVILPAFQCGAGTPGGLPVWPEFAHLAASGGMTLNSVYLARISPGALKQDCLATPGEVMQRGLAPDTAYVLDDALVAAIERRAAFPHDCRRLDGFNLCTRRPFRAP